MQHRDEYRQEIADLTTRIAKADERIHAGHNNIRTLRAEGRPTFASLMWLSGLHRVQEQRRGMLATLQRHNLLIQSG